MSGFAAGSMHVLRGADGEIVIRWGACESCSTLFEGEAASGCPLRPAQGDRHASHPERGLKWIGARQPWWPARTGWARSVAGEPGWLDIVRDFVFGADSPELAVDDYVAIERVGDVFGGWTVGRTDGDCRRSSGLLGSVV